jgi:hypothetical protein
VTWQRDIVKRLRSIRWRAALPERYSWLRLLASPSSYVLFIALALTVAAKMSILRDLEGAGWWPALLMWAIASDTLLHMGLASVFAAGEARVRWLLAVTIPLSLLLLVFAVLNAGYLSETGEQLSARRISDGFDRFADFERAAADFLRRTGWLKLGFLVAVLVGVPLGVRWLIRHQRGDLEPRDHGQQRAVAAAWIAGVAVLVWLVWPNPSAIPAKQMGPSAVVHSYWDWLVGTEDPATQYAEGVDFQGYNPPMMVSRGEIQRFAARPLRPNIVVIIGESARYDYTSLVGDQSHATTPNLVRLAARGAVVPTTRSALPHTTKSVFSMMCGRLPLMQRVTVEVSAALHIQCLPEVLTAAGYNTAFLQSALGTFEQRPRLVDKLGYAHFEAWEEIGGQPLGYLASDDESLAPAMERWLESVGTSKPFFVTLLTSAAHHPYRLSKAIEERAKASGAPTGSAAERYARLIESQDALLGAVTSYLESKGLLENTIVVFLGDHGEGFGAYGVRQHDSNYYEEGLRVPWVMAGPGIAHSTIEGNASLVDVAPSLLSVLGIQPSANTKLDGFSVFDGLKDRPRWFGCWFEMSCRGFVIGNRKVVHIPQWDRLFYFDLSKDPHERTAHSLPDDLEELVPEMHRVIEAHRTRTFPLVAGELTHEYGDWVCPKNRACKHPKSPKGIFFEKP